MRKGDLFRSFENIFVVLCFLIASGGLLPLLYIKSGAPLDSLVGNPLSGAVLAVFYFIVLMLFLANKSLFSKAVCVVQRNKLLFIFLFYLMVSISWSGSLMLSIVRGLALIGATIFGIYFFIRYDRSQQLKLLFWTFGIAAFLSLLFAIFMSTYGIDFNLGSEGVWQGIFAFKNTLGISMCLGAILSLVGMLKKREERKSFFIEFIVFVMCFFLLMASTAVGPLFCFVGVFVLFLGFLIYRTNKSISLPLFIFFISIIIIAIILIISNLSSFLAFFGKGDSLTGRLEIWPAVIDSIKERPFFGYGYYGFWSDPNNAYPIYSKINPDFQPTHAHNGALELVLDSGIIGLFLFLIIFYYNVKRATIFAMRKQTAESFWPMAYFAFFFLFNVSAAMIAKNHGFFWICFVTLTLDLSEFFKSNKLQRQ